MTDKFKDLKLTVGHIMEMSEFSRTNKEICKKITMEEIEDIFQIIDKYSNDQKSIEREFKKYINELIK